MADVVIPDFIDTADFNRFVAAQKDEDIQAWKTVDWNNLYDKLDKIIEPDKRLGFAAQEGKDSLIKLNSNYRLERQDMERLREVSKQIALNIVVALGDNQHKITSVNTDNLQLTEMRKYFAQIFDKAIYDTTNYKNLKFDPYSGKKLSDMNFNINNYQTTKSDIAVEERAAGHAGVRRYKDAFSSQIELTTSTENDDAVGTSLHESMHAHIQTITTAQSAAAKILNTNPLDGMSEGFFKLLRHNSEYYVSDTQDSSGFQQLKSRHLNGDISDEEYRKQAHKNFKGYSKQPLETHAEIMALMTEHYYRQETQQLSERAERAFVNFIGVKPTAVTDYKQVEALLMYQNNSEVMKRFELFKQFINPEQRENIGHFENKDININTFVVPKNFSTTNALRCAEKNMRVAFNLIEMAKCGTPSPEFSNGNCVFYYSPEDTQKIQNMLQKHTNTETAEMFNFDANGALILQQNEAGLDKMLKTLLEIKNDMINNDVNSQKQQIERVRNKINSSLPTAESKVNPAPQSQKNINTPAEQMRIVRESRVL